MTLRNGVSMPLLGLGTSHQGGYSRAAVLHALGLGYRLLDTAARYGCEQQLGEAVRESGVAREQLWQIWPADYGRDQCLAAAEMSIARLGVEYLDLLLLHWPGGLQEEVAGAWRGLEELLEQARVRAIGVSNFQQRHLDRLLLSARVVPHVNQIEFHPYQNDQELVQYCKELGIKVTGYSPLGKGQLLHDQEVQGVAKELGVTPAQVLVKWSMQQGVVAIPKSTKVERVEENWSVWGWRLKEEHMGVLGGLHRGTRVTWDPSTVPCC